MKAGQARARAKKQFERFYGGERAALWAELPSFDRKKQKSIIAENIKVEHAMGFADKGQPGKAVQRIISPGLTPDTPAVEEKLMSKFPTIISGIRTRSIAPQSCAVDATPLREAGSFPQGAAAGPTGARPQFIIDMVGEGGDEGLLVGVVVTFIHFFVDEPIPTYIRQCCAGGALVGIGRGGKPLDQDAKHIVCGEWWRRLAANVALSYESVDLQGRLKPHQLAMSSKGNAYVIIHTNRQWLSRNSANAPLVFSKRE
jgi:hypothetical protein